MGYHVAIVRTAGAKQIPLTRAEIMGLPITFPDWRYDAEQEALIEVVGGDDAPALWASEGELWTKNPSDATLAAMISFATHLGARVRGDEMETYRTVEDSYVHPDDARAVSALKRESGRDFWRWRLKQWAFNAVLLGTFASLIIILKKIGFLE